MSINLRGLTGLLVMLVGSTAFPVMTVAQMQPENYELIPDTFERAYFRYDSNFYDNGSLKRQVDSLFGPGGKFGTTFPDNEIAKDAELVNTVYKDVMMQQAMNDPYLRTPDLPNPYDSSLLMSPRYNANRLKVGTEYRFDSLTSR
ncbi:hypothetical protein A0J48_013820 [Sphaerospermopsis aphanizomenoides BCCUSP55]|uniref:hypothetical protein n=1 Tax=Sphaerospermopsis aphanizomenoides TaxID=459663 RepID=UPI000AF012D0|nr:hypothetical protein [Sphaerospermopsis aphanizomenoides]MBK1988603.1 hypothetical protein [Sphaerospermopsis aphanizomenoides BCCUSP55]